MNTKPTYLMTLIESNGGWTAVGSRSVNFLNIEARREWEELSLTYFSDRSISPSIYHYLVEGSVRSFTVVSAPTQLQALGALLDEFRKQEDAELREAEDKAKRKADIARFGGEVNEELVRKVVRWRKKQAKKAEKEREWDPDDEWDF